MKGVVLSPAGELLAEPAGAATRRVAFALLEAAVAARERLDDPSDAEALHDFRVALRRTRSWINAFEDELGDSIRKKHRRRLSDISHAAGDARDAQVHAVWLRDVEDSLSVRDRPGAEWLLRRVVDHQHEADTALRAIVAEAFSATAAGLAKDLAVYTVRIDLRNPAVPPTLAEAMASRILALAAAVGERLAAVQSMQDQAVAHAARIAGKRLRYVIEPIADGVEGGPGLVKRLRILQDVIGEMHDVHVVAEEVIQAAQDAGADQARRIATALLEGEGDSGEGAVRVERGRDPRPGLLAIAAQLRARGQSAFRDLQQHWLGDHAGELTEAARALAARLTGGGTPTVAPATATTSADATGSEGLVVQAVEAESDRGADGAGGSEARTQTSVNGGSPTQAPAAGLHPTGSADTQVRTEQSTTATSHGPVSRKAGQSTTFPPPGGTISPSGGTS
jgi:CHAD domain-containing protein